MYRRNISLWVKSLRKQAFPLGNAYLSRLFFELIVLTVALATRFSARTGIPFDAGCTDSAF